MCVLQRIFHFWGSSRWRGGTKALRKVPAPQVLFKRTWEFEYLDLMTRRLFLFCASLFSLAAKFLISTPSFLSLSLYVPCGVCNWWEFRNFIYTRLEECDFLIYYSPFTIGISGGQPKFRPPLLFSCNASRIYNMNDVIMYWQSFYVPSIDTQILKHLIKWKKKKLHLRSFFLLQYVLFHKLLQTACLFCENKVKI